MDPKVTNEFEIRSLLWQRIIRINTSNVIADSSITSTKPAESFMKRVAISDGPDGNALGWNPNGVTTAFTISDTDVSSFLTAFITVEVAAGVDNDYFCDTVDQDPDQFQIECSSPPVDGETLHYVLTNIPSHVIF